MFGTPIPAPDRQVQANPATGGRGGRGALQKDRKLRQNGLTRKRSRGVSGCYSAISCPFTGEWHKKKMLVKGVSCALAGFSGGGAGRWSADERKWLKSVFSRIGRNCRFPQSRGKLTISLRNCQASLRKFAERSGVFAPQNGGAVSQHQSGEGKRLAFRLAGALSSGFAVLVERRQAHPVRFRE